MPGPGNNWVPYAYYHGQSMSKGTSACGKGMTCNFFLTHNRPLVQKVKTKVVPGLHDQPMSKIEILSPKHKGMKTPSSETKFMSKHPRHGVGPQAAQGAPHKLPRSVSKAGSQPAHEMDSCRFLPMKWIVAASFFFATRHTQCQSYYKAGCACVSTHACSFSNPGPGTEQVTQLPTLCVPHRMKTHQGRTQMS
jgi:hypothetical protein